MRDGLNGHIGKKDMSDVLNGHIRKKNMNSLERYKRNIWIKKSKIKVKYKMIKI